MFLSTIRGDNYHRDIAACFQLCSLGSVVHFCPSDSSLGTHDLNGRTSRGGWLFRCPVMTTCNTENNNHTSNHFGLAEYFETGFGPSRESIAHCIAHQHESKAKSILVLQVLRIIFYPNRDLSMGSKASANPPCYHPPILIHPLPHPTPCPSPGKPSFHSDSSPSALERPGRCLA